MKAAHFTSAKLLWNTTAYCDQWLKAMAIYDDSGNLRCVIKDEEDGGYDVLLIGDDEKVLYYTYNIRLGTVKDNMEACFKLHLDLKDVWNPTFSASKSCPKNIEVYEILTHTRVGAMRHGQFRKIEDASEKIAFALEELDRATASMGAECVFFDEGPGDEPFDYWLGSAAGIEIMGGVFDD